MLFEDISKHLREDEYFESTICSIYLDNDNNDLIINSIEKPLYKNKVRIRSYGIPTLDDYVYLEIKSKYKRVVGKRRIRIKLRDYYKYIQEGIYDINNQIMREIDYLFKYYKLYPKMFVAYDRKSYIGIADENLRITIDSKLRSRRNNLQLEVGDSGDNYFEKEYYIMEIKTLEAMPLWLVRCLSKLEIYPTSFSKYGSIYTKYFKGDDSNVE